MLNPQPSDDSLYLPIRGHDGELSRVRIHPGVIAKTSVFTLAFSPGDLVQLKSGGTVMAVVCRGPADSTIPDHYVVEWSGEALRQFAVYHKDMLAKVTPR